MADALVPKNTKGITVKVMDVQRGGTGIVQASVGVGGSSGRIVGSMGSRRQSIVERMRGQRDRSTRGKDGVNVDGENGIGVRVIGSESSWTGRETSGSSS
jgi:hypothetical protein